MNKQETRARRARRARAQIQKLNIVRLSVYRSLNHIYAQLISPCNTKVLAAASTLEKSVRSKLKHGGNKDAAVVVGKLIAERAVKAGIKRVAFDRSGYRYHGCVKALADAAREGGLDF